MLSGLIAAVAPDSLGERVDLRPGDELLALNEHRPRDVIDVHFYSAEKHLALQVRRRETTFNISVERRYGEPLGLEFTQPTFDGIRRCNNRCEFCFVAQMPAGLRPSLYVRDDDYRHSFLFGNYITLTNLDEADWERIGKQHLSPLYVSVHATDIERRRRVLGNPDAPDVIAQLRRLANLGIETHTQIVVTPGLNDGPHLARSIGDLADMYPAVRSVSVVPVGLTKYHQGNCRTHTQAEMRATFEQVTGWQARLHEQLGVNFAYLSDEWRLRLEEEIPLRQTYNGLNLTENGVGLVRQFLDQREAFQDAIAGRGSQAANITLATGVLFAPVLRSLVADLPAQVIPIVNHFFGDTVTVAGLLAGRDVIAQLRKRELDGVVALPTTMFGGPEGQSLDEMWPQEIAEALECQVMVGMGQ